MTITDTLIKQKTHIIYGALIVVIGLVTYHFFKKPPELITKTLTKVETQVKTIEKVITKDRVVYIDRTITTHKKNGDVIVEVSHEHSDTQSKVNTSSKEVTQIAVTQKTVESFMKRYSVETLFPILNDSFKINSNPLDTQIILGVRVFSLPVFLEAGSNARFNQLIVGLRLEF